MSKFYNINVNLDCIYQGSDLMPLIYFFDENLQELVENRNTICEGNEIRLIPNIYNLNKSLVKEMKKNSIPEGILFTLEKEEGEYIHIKEVFTGLELLADKGLAEVCKINRLEATVRVFKYTDKELLSIQNIMQNYYIHNQIINHNVIDFETRKKMRKC